MSKENQSTPPKPRPTPIRKDDAGFIPPPPPPPRKPIQNPPQKPPKKP